MPTKTFTSSLQAMSKSNPDFASELLEDALNAMLSGSLDDGRILLRDYVKATIGFQELSRRTGKADKNLMRSLGPNGSPTASNLFDIIQACVRDEGVSIAARVTPSAEAGMSVG